MAIDKSVPNKNHTEKQRQDILVEKSWFVWVLMFGFWTVFSTVLTIQDLFIWIEAPEKFEGWAALLFNSFPYYYSWFALTPLVFWLGEKFRFGEKEKNLRNVIIHTFLGVLTVAIYLAITSFITSWVAGKASEFENFAAIFNKRVYMVGHFQFIVYWAILGVYISFENYKKFREREREASRLLLRSTSLESQLAKAQLDALKMQLHPHFLFNTLHAISALMEDSPKSARRMIARLGELLRSTLDISEKQTIPLEKELTLTKLYLEIEQERFQDKLKVKMDFPKEDLDCLVPSLILQPLVENAIKHGITDEEKNAVIEIKAVKRNKKLHIFVGDNGPGFSENQTMEMQDGIGLSNTKARLEQLYGSEHEFNIGNSEKGGALIEIILPCKKARTTDENE